MVLTLLLRQGLRSRQSAYAGMIEEGQEELTLNELARRLNVPQPTLYSWLRRGLLHGRQVIHADHPLWLIQADEAELARLSALRTSAKS
jgi:hypothetical protein